VFAAFDLSKASAGWACWDGHAASPRYGSQSLGSGSLTSDGLTFARVHRMMNEVRAVVPFEKAFVEEPLQPRAVQSHTTFDTLFLLYGLAAHAASFCEAKGVTFEMKNQSSWRRHFIGSMKRGTKSKNLKDYTIERCRHYGWTPKNSDEADALGLLDYAISLAGITPPWVQANPLVGTVGGRR
jgi:hypothetical protein